MTQQSRTFVVSGGLDQITSTLTIASGSLRACMNYEPIEEGYATVDGYERFDGQPAPSAAGYWVMPYTAGSTQIQAGQIIIGGTSAATGIALLASDQASGTWAAGNSAGRLIMTRVTGTFVAGENLIVNGLPRAVSGAGAVRSGADTVDEDEAFLEAAQTRQRGLIAKPPGDGPVRGVAELDGTVYAFRNNAMNAACGIFRETTTGWAQVGIGCRLVRFTAGLVELDEGQTIRGKVSGATGLVRRVVRNAGDWGSTASGYLIVTGQVGVFGAETLQVGVVDVATTAANSSVVALPPGGNYRFIRHNFFGGTATRRIYGANGVGNGFEFDGEVLCPIETGSSDDRPTRISEHREHLVFGFRGGSVQLSSDNSPHIFDGVQGAAEFGIGADITDFLKLATSLVVFAVDRIAVLTGSGVDSYVLETIGGEDDVGADPYTAQKLGQAIYLDNRGLRYLNSSSSFGNFRYGQLTENVEKLLKAKRISGVLVALSFVNRTKGHYRLIWNDGTGISLYLRGRNVEVMPFELGDMRPVSVVVSERPGGDEGIFVGAEDGYVYRMDSGTSHDGDRINAFLMFPFNSLGSHTQNKRYHGIEVEIDSGARSRIGLLCQFDYANGRFTPDGQVTFFASGNANNDAIVSGGGGIWDVSRWDEFYWSTAFEGQVSRPVKGRGRNISVLISSRRHAVERAHIIKSYTVYFSPQGLQRPLVKA